MGWGGCWDETKGQIGTDAHGCIHGDKIEREAGGREGGEESGGEQRRVWWDLGERERDD